jgi:hypothetical protein
VKKASDLTAADWVVGGLVGGVAGFLLGLLSKGPITAWKQRNNIDPAHRIHHADIGGTMATLGALSAASNPLAPIITGFGTGLAVEDYADQYGYRVFTNHMKKVRENEVFAQTDPVRAKTEWKTIPDIPRSARYGAMADTIRGIIYEDANNPEIRSVAEQLIKEAGLDGRDTEAILTAFTLWIRSEVTYLHDVAKDTLGKPTDQYRHAYITLPQSPTNPRGTGAGDCDCMFILWSAMAMSVGVENIVGLLVAQQKPGIYNHILPAYSPTTPNPQSVDDLVGFELTEDKPVGWIPPAKGYGFLLL